MKKILTLILAGAISCSLCACGGDSASYDENAPTQTETTSQTEKKEEATPDAEDTSSQQTQEDKEEEKAE